jgi:SAM-dependent methyltransferase
MDLQELQSHWNEFGLRDPLWAVVTSPEFRGGLWDETEFFRRGEREIADLFADLSALGISPRRWLALDFGCGVGRLTQPLCRRFLRVHGVDIAPSMLAVARRFNRHPLRCRYLLNVSDDLRALPSARYDFVVSIIVLQHMRPFYAARYLHELVRVLAWDGVLIFQLPSEPSSMQIDVVAPENARRATALAESGSTAADRQSPLRRPVAMSAMPPVRRWPSFVGRIRGACRPADLGEDLASLPRVDEPSMEMYGIPFEEVLRIVASAGGVVVDASHDPWAGPAWRSYRYCVLKRTDRLPVRRRPGAMPEVGAP